MWDVATVASLYEIQRAGYKNLCGLDYSALMIMLASNTPNLKVAKLRQRSAEELPFEENAVDAVLLFAPIS